jgi:tol-pal system protein YbgF
VLARWSRCSVLALAVAATSAQAGLFDDEEARRAINDLNKRIDVRFAKLEAELNDRRAVLDLAGALEGLKQDIAALRGQIEVVTNRVDQADRRQRDLYVDLDNRLRKFEQVQADKDKSAQTQAAEQSTYETALGQMKANNYGAAIQQLQSFMQQYPQSQLVSSAQYWVGNAYYALRDYKSAMTAQQKLIATWPESAKAPDAMLNIASSQAEMGDLNGSRNTLKTLMAKYPGSPAAEQAKQRLAKK